MIDLPELKRLVTDLHEDLLVVAQDAEKDAGLRQAHGEIQRGGRTGEAFETWREDYLEQVAVAWVLSCVFVRFMEDNDLVAECWLAGDGERRRHAEDNHELYFRDHPEQNDRHYFQHVFHEVGGIPACADLFAEGKTPLWALGPSGDAAMRLLNFWREIDPANGNLKRSLKVEERDTRFLGDLYQDLSESARKKYALLQTPVFIEEFILDRTLSPALDTFGLEIVQMIDPTCGSGHFLLGGFERLFRLWMREEDNEIAAAQKTLDAVAGVDVNPFAVAIARFRLIVAAMNACDIRRLTEAPAWHLNLAAGDSLLFGGRWNGEAFVEQQWLDQNWAPEIYACEDREALQRILGRQYHAVVGNPPYITVKDKALNQAYRNKYQSCHRKYSLAVPFMERFFELTVAGDGTGRKPAGITGMITANSFMKREFGKKLIEEYVPRWDLTHVIDTSGAYIPGHGTPTVILFGKHQSPQADTIRTVMGIKGEPATPDEPAEGLVWTAIVNQVDQPGSESEFVSADDTERAAFHHHPWSIGGGGAAELKDTLDETANGMLGALIESAGFGCIMGEDDAFSATTGTNYFSRLPADLRRPLVEGDNVRDWAVVPEMEAVFPYSPAIELRNDDSLLDWLWAFRTYLKNRRDFSKRTYAEAGKPYWGFHQIPVERNRAPMLLSFAFVATHNHFVLDRGGKVFKQSAPVIKLPDTATEDDHLGLLGLLNSSTACFWMKQVFYPKSSSTGDISTEKGKPEANRYEFAGTGIKPFPIPAGYEGRCMEIARNLDQLSQSLQAQLPSTIIGNWTDEIGNGRLQNALHDGKREHARLRARMIALQEELDWEAYKIYGLSEEGADEHILNDETLGIHEDERPFRWNSNAPPESLTAIIRPLYERRRMAVTQTSSLKTIETPVFKRLWLGRQGVYGQASRTYDEWIADACRERLWNRLESQRYWPDANTAEPQLQSVARLADKASGDHDFLELGALYRGRRDFDVTALVDELVRSQSVPFLPAQRYKATGLRKRQVWEKVWDLQRKEDRGEAVDNIPVPPKYSSADFLKSEHWKLRGKLDVPKERWVSYPNCESDTDPTLPVAWAGWNHLQQATALVAYYDARKRDGWSPERLTPLLAGLDQLLPWIHQWHPEVDPDFGETAGQSFQTMLEADAHELGLTLETIRAWQPPATQRKRAQRKKKAARKRAD